MAFSPLRWQDDPPAVVLLDQTRLPAAEEYLTCADVSGLIDAIKRLAVRGAPLLGVAGAYGVALAAVRGEDVAAAARALAAARPTAVNLSWGVHRVLDAYRAAGDDPGRALAEAVAVEAEDAAAAARLVDAGLALVPRGARILTHCNTGRLVSAGPGTALGIAAAAHRLGLVKTLWVDETRPLLQGARLTAWEAKQAGIPYQVLADAAAGALFAGGEVDLVLVGADRVAADGTVANKVGTYPLAVLARHHGVPFVVAAPASTIDLDTGAGSAIQVEQRSPEEVTSFAGRPVAPGEAAAYNPAFDRTPAELITALVTDEGVVEPVTGQGLRRVAESAARRRSGAGGATISP